MTLKQFVIPPAAGKRLIGKAMAKHPIIQNVLDHGTLVILPLVDFQGGISAEGFEQARSHLLPPHCAFDVIDTFFDDANHNMGFMQQQ